MTVLAGVGLVSLGALIGMFVPFLMGANREECPYQDICPKYVNYKCNYIKGNKPTDKDNTEEGK